MKWTPIPDDKTREEYIARVIEIYKGKSLSISEINFEAERLYHFDHDDWLSEAKEQREMELINNH